MSRPVYKILIFYFLIPTIVRENVRNTAKNVDFEKRKNVKKRRSNNNNNNSDNF